MSYRQRRCSHRHGFRQCCSEGTSDAEAARTLASEQQSSRHGATGMMREQIMRMKRVLTARCSA
eukprot:4168465-Pleurochrysis_carterae.AAC.1